MRPQIQKLTIVDIDYSSQQDGTFLDSLEVQFNPTDFTRSIAANYKEHEILGQSFKPQEWTFTNNQEINMSIYLEANDQETQAGLELAQNFIESFLYPPKTDNFVVNSPSRMLIIWPNTMTLRCRLHKAIFNHLRFNRELQTISQRIDLQLREAAVRRITKRQVQLYGPRRGQKGADQSG